jgi:hypothetical protein
MKTKTKAAKRIASEATNGEQEFHRRDGQWVPGREPDPERRKRSELLAKELQALNGKFMAKAQKDGVYRAKYIQDVHAWARSRVGSTKGVMGFLDAEIKAAQKPKKGKAKKKAVKKKGAK